MKSLTTLEDTKSATTTSPLNLTRRPQCFSKFVNFKFNFLFNFQFHWIRFQFSGPVSSVVAVRLLHEEIYNQTGRLGTGLAPIELPTSFPFTSHKNLGYIKLLFGELLFIYFWNFKIREGRTLIRWLMTLGATCRNPLCTQVSNACHSSNSRMFFKLFFLISGW